MTVEMKNKTDLLNELAKVINWNPDEEGLTPHVEIDSFKATHLVKRYLIDRYPEKAEGFGRESGKTLYSTLKDHPLGNLVLFAYDYLSVEDLYDLTCKDKGPNGLYPYALDAGKGYIEELRIVCRSIYRIRQGLDFTVKEEEGDTEAPVDVDKLMAELDDAKTMAKNAATAEKKALEDLSRIKETVRDLTVKARTHVTETVVESDGTIPTGKSVMRKISELFPSVDFGGKDFEVTAWEWDGVHPDVPVVDPNYIFRPKQLLRVLYAAATNQRCYLQGDTGSGKTTLYLQAAAVLNQPVARINFNSDIDSYSLMGKESMKAGDTSYEEGILPRTLVAPYWLICDEMDAVKPDISYIFQPVLEGNGLRLMEDGGRFLQPHPQFRLFATGNTVGQGDENGMYAAVRPQSLALLDRFEVWARVPYLTKEERSDLLRKHAPMLSTEQFKAIEDYVTEHMEAFTKGTIIQPISPRGMMAVADAVSILDDVGESLSMVVLDKANQEDYAVLKGIVDRVSK